MNTLLNERHCSLCNSILQKSHAYEDVIESGGEVIGGSPGSFGLQGTVCTSCGYLFCFDCLQPGECLICGSDLRPTIQRYLPLKDKPIPLDLKILRSFILQKNIKRISNQAKEICASLVEKISDIKAFADLQQLLFDSNCLEEARCASASAMMKIDKASTCDAFLSILNQSASSQHKDKRILETILFNLEEIQETRAVPLIIKLLTLKNFRNLRDDDYWKEYAFHALNRIAPDWRSSNEARKLIDTIYLPPLIKSLKGGDLEVENDLDIIDPSWMALPEYKTEFGVCWFCGAEIAGKYEPYELEMHRRDSSGDIDQKSIRIPRCATCKSHQSTAKTASTTGGILGILVFIVGTARACVHFMDSNSFLGFMGVVLWFSIIPVSFFVGGLLGNLIVRPFSSAKNSQAVLKRRFGISIGKPVLFWEDYPIVRSLCNKGWKVGSGR